MDLHHGPTSALQAPSTAAGPARLPRPMRMQECMPGLLGMSTFAFSPQHLTFSRLIVPVLCVLSISRIHPQLAPRIPSISAIPFPFLHPFFILFYFVFELSLFSFTRSPFYAYISVTPEISPSSLINRALHAVGVSHRLLHLTLQGASSAQNPLLSPDYLYDSIR